MKPMFLFSLIVPAILNEAVPATTQNVQAEVTSTTKLAFVYTGMITTNVSDASKCYLYNPCEVNVQLKDINNHRQFHNSLAELVAHTAKQSKRELC